VRSKRARRTRCWVADQRWSEAGQTARRRRPRTRRKTTRSESSQSSGIDCGHPYARYIAAEATAGSRPLAGGGWVRFGEGDLGRKGGQKQERVRCSCFFPFFSFAVLNLRFRVQNQITAISNRIRRRVIFFLMHSKIGVDICTSIFNGCSILHDAKPHLRTAPPATLSGLRAEPRAQGRRTSQQSSCR
jgi:hypothetical protein